MADITIRAAQDRVRCWHEERGIPTPSSPTLSTLADRILRASLIREESTEAIRELDQQTADASLERIAHELADLLYVTLGSAVALGIDLEAAFAAVADANDTKMSTRDSRGKITKGPHYQKPDMGAAVGRVVRDVG